MSDQAVPLRFKAHIQILSDRFSIKPDVAFLVWGIESITPLDPEDIADEIVVDGPRDLGIDGIWVDDDRRVLSLFQAKYSAEGGRGIGRNDVEAFAESLGRISNPEYVRKLGNRLIVQRIREVVEAMEKGYAVEMHFFCYGHFTKDVASFESIFNAKDPRIQLKLYGIDAVHSSFVESETMEGAVPSNVSIKCVSREVYEHKHGDILAVAATIEGVEIAKLAKKYGFALFQRNVRYYLSSGNRINKRIREGLASAETRGRFWCLNNGLSIVCKSFKLDDANSQIVLDELQIVNGCQTTMTLGEAYSENQDLSRVKLLVKIIRTDSQELLDNITESTNSQSTVKLRDFRSNDAIHLRIARELEVFGYGYIHKRGMASKFPTVKQIDMELAAQAIMAFDLRLASEAKSSKSGIFAKQEDDGYYEEIFCEKLSGARMLLAVLLFNVIHKKRNEFRSERRKVLKQIQEAKAVGGETKGLETYLQDNEYILHADFHRLALIGEYLRVHYKVPRLSDKVCEAIARSAKWNDLAERFYKISSAHISSLVRQKFKDVNFSFTRYFKGSEALKEIFGYAAERIGEYEAIENKRVFDNFPLPKA